MNALGDDATPVARRALNAIRCVGRTPAPGTAKRRRELDVERGRWRFQAVRAVGELPRDVAHVRDVAQTVRVLRRDARRVVDVEAVRPVLHEARARVAAYSHGPA